MGFKAGIIDLAKITGTSMVPLPCEVGNQAQNGTGCRRAGPKVNGCRNGEKSTSFALRSTLPLNDRHPNPGYEDITLLPLSLSG